MTTYAVKEIFYTLQGEGALVGTPAVFVRFSGCNLWSGRDADRERDRERHAAVCPVWCDTDFTGGASMTEEKVVARAVEVFRGWCPEGRIPLVVFTGGEPTLQLTSSLVRAMSQVADRLAIETNGTRPLPAAWSEVGGWTTVSPKTHPSRLAITQGDEIKLVLAADPDEGVAADLFLELAKGFAHRWISPCAATLSVGVSRLSTRSTAAAVDWVRRHPEWRLNVQAHKVVGIR